MEDHLAADVVVALMEGELSAEEEASVDDHIDECADCRRLVTEMAKSSSIRHKSERIEAPAPESPRSSLLVAGEVLADRFRVVKPLGRGSMGAVYEARDEELDVRVALKVLTPEAAAQPRYVDRLRREIVLGRRVTHPNVCRLYDMGQSDGRRFITMELLEGETLAERIARGPVHPREAFRICEMVGNALEVAHAHGIVHRDLKPANIMLVADGDVKVMDFGLAMDLNAERSTVGVRIGTPAYWSPEQARGERATERSDIYSMAVIFCELLGGKRPGWAEEPDLDAVTPIFRPIVMKCLEVNPAQRYASVAEARADLDRAWAMVEGRRPYKRRFLVLAGAAGLALGVIATIAVLLSL